MISGGYTAPVGLLGVTSTIARTRSSISAAARTGSGTNPASASQGSGSGAMPNIRQTIS